MDKCSGDSGKALFYVRQTLENGWSRDVLLNASGTGALRDYIFMGRYVFTITAAGMRP